MLHSKLYLLEMPNGTAAAFVGSHNLTGFALLGQNGEASLLVEGSASEPEFAALRRHVNDAIHRRSRR
jgi:HKD family nuclease